jgi:hypothetical protein
MEHQVSVIQPSEEGKSITCLCALSIEISVIYLCPSSAQWYSTDFSHTDEGPKDGGTGLGILHSVFHFMVMSTLYNCL